MLPLQNATLQWDPTGISMISIKPTPSIKRTSLVRVPGNQHHLQNPGIHHNMYFNKHSPVTTLIYIQDSRSNGLSFWWMGALTCSCVYIEWVHPVDLCLSPCQLLLWCPWQHARQVESDIHSEEAGMAFLWRIWFLLMTYLLLVETQSWGVAVFDI